MENDAVGAQEADTAHTTERKPQVERFTRRLDHSVPEPAIFDDAPDPV